MKIGFILAVLALIPGVGFGQGAAIDNDVDAELDQIYTQQIQPRRKLPRGQTREQVQLYGAEAAPSPTVYKQPTTYVEATPLSESKADLMRKSRVDAEVQTETKIVEKLEQSRLDDEKKRADVLFGSKFEQLSQTQQVTPPASQPAYNPNPAPVTPVQQPVPVQVILPKDYHDKSANKDDEEYESKDKESLTRDSVREEISAALKAEKEAESTGEEQKYFTGLLGFPDYPDSSNIKGNYSLGATFGTKFDDAYAVEGTFIFSNFTMNPVYQSGFIAPDLNVNQYSASLGMKYFLFTGMVKPFMGGILQYSYRTYNWSNNNNYYNNSYYNYGYNNNSSQSSSSHAIDLGLNLGADVEFNRKFTIGVDYRYFFNLSSRRDNSAFVYQPYYGTPLEQVHASLLSFTAKVKF